MVKHKKYRLRYSIKDIKGLMHLTVLPESAVFNSTFHEVNEGDVTRTKADVS